MDRGGMAVERLCSGTFQMWHILKTWFSALRRFLGPLRSGTEGPAVGEKDGGKPPVSVEVGLRGIVELKTEIPKESTGRLVDALTDIIRPFTEARGLKADQIRLQREDVLFEIASKARSRADLERVDLHPVPTKLLVPFLEKASLEERDKDMQDRWAALLLSASKEYHARHLTFVDILSRLSSDEV